MKSSLRDRSQGKIHHFSVPGELRFISNLPCAASPDARHAIKSLWAVAYGFGGLGSMILGVQGLIILGGLGVGFRITI